MAAEVYSALYRMGCEEPLVYINAGPHPRVHSEPMSEIRVARGTAVTVVVGADYCRYYANTSRTVVVGQPRHELAREALKAMDEAYDLALNSTRPGARFIDVIRKLDSIFEKRGLLDYRIVGYAHGVGLQIEETPITTILPRDRVMRVKPGMVLAMIHSPILLPGLGQVKREDTFIVREDGLERVT